MSRPAPLQIPRPQRGMARAEWLVLWIFVAALLFVVYQVSMAWLSPDGRATREEIGFLREEVEVLAGRLEKSQARVAVLERETEVVRQANRLLREEESKRQDELNQLQAQVDFYSRLAGTGGSQNGLAVHQVEITTTPSPMVYRFVLTLTQNIRRASIVSGKASIDLEGTLDDRPVTLYWSNLAEGTTPDTAFRFKYFQQLEGYLTLPEAFSPTRLLVSLDVKGQRKPVVQDFEWSELISTPES